MIRREETQMLQAPVSLQASWLPLAAISKHEQYPKGRHLLTEASCSLSLLSHGSDFCGKRPEPAVRKPAMPKAI